MTNNQTLHIGMIGLDTSHVKAFADLLHDEQHPYYVPGARITIAFRGGSPDLPVSADRIDAFTEQLVEQHGVTLTDSLEELAEQSDAILLESVDGRVHLEQFRAIARFGKPVFIDKPFALTYEHAQEMIALSKQYGTPVMSSSSLRYAESLRLALADDSLGEIIGAECSGPLMPDAIQGLFWYGIHTTDMLYQIMGAGCEQVTVVDGGADAGQLLITGRWADGRLGTVRGNPPDSRTFGALIHRRGGSQHVQVQSEDKPYYASLMEQIIQFFHSGTSPIRSEELLEVVAFLQTAEACRSSHEQTQRLDQWRGDNLDERK